jgi:hypothetical protein
VTRKNESLKYQPISIFVCQLSSGVCLDGLFAPCSISAYGAEQAYGETHTLLATNHQVFPEPVKSVRSTVWDALYIVIDQKRSLDFWGVVDKEWVSSVYTPFIEGLKKMVPEHLQTKKYPFIWDFGTHVERVVREALMGNSEKELEELARSFSFEKCVKRDGLNVILQRDGQREGEEKI